MNNNNTRYSSKNWLWMAIIVAVAVLAYFMFFSKPAVDESVLLTQPGGGEEVGLRVLNLLNQIQSLRIDATLFQSAAYRSLQDYTVEIPTDTVGRDNPFAPIPGYVPRANTTTR